MEPAWPRLSAGSSRTSQQQLPLDEESEVQANALRVFASYLPAGLVLSPPGLWRECLGDDASSDDPQPPDRPEREDFDAVVCFLDVSGFTALSEALSKAAWLGLSGLAALP